MNIDKAYFEQRVVVDPATGCHNWQRAKNSTGYGVLGFRGKVWLAHRVAWTIEYETEPSGFFVCHKCDNPACVNVEHLFLGDNLANIHDCMSKGRRARRDGMRNGRAKLTDEDVAKIRVEPGKHRDIAARWGVSHSQVGKIKRGESRA